MGNSTTRQFVTSETPLQQKPAQASFAGSCECLPQFGLHPLYAEAYRRARQTVLIKEHVRLRYLGLN